MMRIAEALEAFRPLRGDALVVPGRGGRYWVEQTDNEKLDAPLGDPGSALLSPAPIAKPCCSIPRATS
jgi:hypothetical protein